MKASTKTILLLIQACDSLMGELMGKSAADWALINTAMVDGRQIVLKESKRRKRAKNLQNLPRN